MNAPAKTQRGLVEHVHMRADRTADLQLLGRELSCAICNRKIGYVGVEDEADLVALANLSRDAHVKECRARVTGEWHVEGEGLRCVWRQADGLRGKLSARVVKRGVAYRYEVSVGQDVKCITGYCDTQRQAQEAAVKKMRSVIAWGK